MSDTPKYLQVRFSGVFCVGCSARTTYSGCFGRNRMKFTTLCTTSIRGVIDKVRCSFLWIYTPIPYSVVFLLHVPAPAPAPIKISFGAARCGLVWCGVSAVLRFELDSFGLDWVSSNVNLNLKNPPLQQLKNLANYSIQI